MPDEELSPEELQDEIEMVDRAGLADAIEQHATEMEGNAFVTLCTRAEWHVIIAALRTCEKTPTSA